MLLLRHLPRTPTSTALSSSPHHHQGNTTHHNRSQPLRPPSRTTTAISYSISQPSFFPSASSPRTRAPLIIPRSTSSSDGLSIPHQQTGEPTGAAAENEEKKSFWGAVSLIIGTAVGPGMLGLPSATIKAGPVPSSAAIILSWIYVVSSILLVAELSFSAMEEDGIKEVSFTGLAAAAFGPGFGAVVAVVYALLSFSLLIACVSGIGSLLVQQFPVMNPVVVHAVAPLALGAIIGFFPFGAIDTTNRLLCSVMIFSITALVTVGLSVGRANLIHSLAFASWSPSAILPAIPVTVLTLGFHVITPFMCRVVGDSALDARKAILFGGMVPLAMVLSWNLVVLGLSGTTSAAASSCGDPIKLLLSVNPSALPAVRGFAFTALATSLVGYAVSFPKQVLDTVELVGRMAGARKDGALQGCCDGGPISEGNGGGGAEPRTVPLMWVVLGSSILVAVFFQASFSRALDFAGVYANCFLFGILPPAMAWIHRSKRTSWSSERKRTTLLPGGNVSLLLLFITAIILGIWH